MNKSVDVGKAFSHLFEDPEKGNKILVGAVIGIVPILNFALFGYEVRLARNVVQGEARPLPSWDDLGGLFMDGLLLGLARLVYGLPIALLMLPFFFVVFMPLFAAAFAGSVDNEAAETIFGLTMSIGLLLVLAGFGLAMLYALAFGFLNPAITANYARHGTFASCFAFGDILAFVRRTFNNYLVVWLSGIAASFLFSFVYSVVLFVPCLGTLLAMPVLALGIFYMYSVIGHALGQAMALDTPAAPPA